MCPKALPATKDSFGLVRLVQLEAVRCACSGHVLYAYSCGDPPSPAPRQVPSIDVTVEETMVAEEIDE
jgi:hypothetical protein